LTLRSAAINSASMRCSASGVWPSKRSTSTGVVLLARIRPKPSAKSTRRPSMVPISPPTKLGSRPSACARQQLGHHRVVLALGAGHVQLGRAEAGGQGVEQALGSALARQDLQQPRGGVHRVVETVPALAEEDVAAHLAGKSARRSP
jgi:hypothetical protein